MTEMTNETVKDVAVYAVEQFINNQTPLAESLAKQASNLGLNPEMIKRAVEGTNQIAYLKLLGMSKDRAFEFPTASYESVMGNMIGVADPTTEPNLDIIDSKANINPGFNHDMSSGNGVAAVNGGNIISEPEKQAWARQGIMANHLSLLDLEIEKAAMLMNIGDYIKKCYKEDYFIEKLAEVCTEDEFPKLVKLATNHDASEFTIQRRIFKDEELNVARGLVDLYKRAQVLVANSDEKEGLDKQAFVAGMTGLLGKSVGGMAGMGAGLLGAGVVMGAKKLGGKGVLTAGENVLGGSFAQPKPSHDVWENLHGNLKRY